MTAGEVEKEIIALNLKSCNESDVKVIYMFPNKNNRRTTSCVIEVSSGIRNLLLKEKHIFIKYSACSFSDHIRVLQCFKCLAFGHMAKDCKSSAMCGHCAGGHELRNCDKRAEAPTCGNCKRWLSNDVPSHAAMDSTKCPILRRKLEEKIKYINYG